MLVTVPSSNPHHPLPPEVPVHGIGMPAHREPPTPTRLEPPQERAPRLTWAGLLRRSFALDVFACGRCGGRLRVLAYLTAPGGVRALLEHLALPTLPGRLAPARGPPQNSSTWHSAFRHSSAALLCLSALAPSLQHCPWPSYAPWPSAFRATESYGSGMRGTEWCARLSNNWNYTPRYPRCGQTLRGIR